MSVSSSTEETIYQPAVEQTSVNQGEVEVNKLNRRKSSSSEFDEAADADTSDDTVEINYLAERVKCIAYSPTGASRTTDCDRPSTSSGHPWVDNQAITGGQGDEAIGNAERWAEEVIHDVEASRARMINVQGLFPNSSNNELVHTALVDQNYFMVVAHVDDMTHRRIVNNQYMDFA